jgi:hypothetical protein
MSARPEGDPASLEAAAAAILAIASRLDGVDTLIMDALPARAFEARGRTRVNSALRSSAHSVAHTAESLQRLAGRLGRGATELRHDQQRWDDAQRARREHEVKAKAEAERRAVAARAR